jgi:hypothetical protein
VNRDALLFIGAPVVRADVPDVVPTPATPDHDRAVLDCMTALINAARNMSAAYTIGHAGASDAAADEVVAAVRALDAANAERWRDRWPAALTGTEVDAVLGTGPTEAPAWASLTLAWGMDGSDYDTIAASLGHFFDEDTHGICAQITRKDGTAEDYSMRGLFNDPGSDGLDRPCLRVVRHVYGDGNYPTIGDPFLLPFADIARVLIF